MTVRDLKVAYLGLTGMLVAVDDVSLDIREREWLSIVGESGSGKSTLAFSLINLVPPPGKIVAGKIVFEGRDILSLTREELRMLRGKEISMIFQDPMTSLDPLRRVGDQIAEVMLEHEGGGKREAWRKAEKLVRGAGLRPDILYRYPHELSGGQRQRIMISMAMILEPKILIADEPTTALDVIVQDAIMNLLEELKSLGTTIILITHDLALAAERSDRIAVMYAGRLVEVGDADSVIDSPLHPYTKGLLDSVPDVWSDEPVIPIPGSPPDLRNPPRGCRFHPRCPYTTEKCKKEEPPRVLVDGGRMVSCWLRVEDRESRLEGDG